MLMLFQNHSYDQGLIKVEFNYFRKWGGGGGKIGVKTKMYAAARAQHKIKF